MIIRPEIIDLHPLMTSWRHALHKHPQIACQETYAHELIKGQLDKLGIPYTVMAGTGIVATIESHINTSGRTIGLRADMDALEVEEKNDFDHKSVIPGQKHGCGHDGHMTMLLGATAYLAKNRDRFNGTVCLIFQPGEEIGYGAKQMIKEGLLARFKMNDPIYAYHTWPYAPAGSILISPGTWAAVDMFEGEFVGPGGHAAMPDECEDPISLYLKRELTHTEGPNRYKDLMKLHARFGVEMDALVRKFKSANKVAIWSETSCHTSTKEGVKNTFPESLRFYGTVRTTDPDVSREFERRMQGMIVDAAKGRLEYHRVTPALINNPEQAEICRKLAEEFVGKENAKDFPSKTTGEDFAFIMQHRPGSFILLGQGTGNLQSPQDKPLHDTEFDFNDDVLPIGVEFWARLVEQKLAL